MLLDMARRLQILARLGFRIHPKGIQIINEESFKLLRKNMHKFFNKRKDNVCHNGHI